MSLTKEILKNSIKYYISFQWREQNVIYEPLKYIKYGYFNIKLSDNKSGFIYA